MEQRYSRLRKLSDAGGMGRVDCVHWGMIFSLNYQIFQSAMIDNTLLADFGTCEDRPCLGRISIEGLYYSTWYREFNTKCAAQPWISSIAGKILKYDDCISLFDARSESHGHRHQESAIQF